MIWKIDAATVAGENGGRRKNGDLKKRVSRKKRMSEEIYTGNVSKYEEVFSRLGSVKQFDSGLFFGWCTQAVQAQKIRSRPCQNTHASSFNVLFEKTAAYKKHGQK